MVSLSSESLTKVVNLMNEYQVVSLQKVLLPDKVTHAQSALVMDYFIDAVRRRTNVQIAYGKYLTNDTEPGKKYEQLLQLAALVIDPKKADSFIDPELKVSEFRQWVESGCGPNSGDNVKIKSGVTLEQSSICENSAFLNYVQAFNCTAQNSQFCIPGKDRLKAALIATNNEVFVLNEMLQVAGDLTLDDLRLFVHEWSKKCASDAHFDLFQNESETKAQIREIIQSKRTYWGQFVGTIRAAFNSVVSWFQGLSVVGWAILLVLPAAMVYSGLMDTSSWGIDRIKDMCFSWGNAIKDFYMMNQGLMDTLFVILPLHLAILIYFKVPREKRGWAIAVNLLILALVGFSVYNFYHVCIKYHAQLSFVFKRGDKAGDTVASVQKEFNISEKPVTEISDNIMINGELMEKAKGTLKNGAIGLKTAEMVLADAKKKLEYAVKAGEGSGEAAAAVAQAENTLKTIKKRLDELTRQNHDLQVQCNAKFEEILVLNPKFTGSSPTDTMQSLRQNCTDYSKLLDDERASLTQVPSDKNWGWSWNGKKIKYVNGAWLDENERVWQIPRLSQVEKFNNAQRFDPPKRWKGEQVKNKDGSMGPRRRIRNEVERSFIHEWNFVNSVDAAKKLQEKQDAQLKLMEEDQTQNQFVNGLTEKLIHLAENRLNFLKLKEKSGSAQNNTATGSPVLTWFLGHIRP